MEKIAIIGMGTSGMAVAAAYAKEVDPSKVEIDCYDSEKSFGRGYPYREESDEIILNLKTRKISYDYQNNDDLANWLEDKNLPMNDYTSRNVFGIYTSDRLADTLNKLKANKISQKVTRLDWLEDKSLWEVETIEGNIKQYDRVHLCAGELGERDPYNLSQYKGYIGSVYPCLEKLNHIEGKDKTCIIGVGLTGVDVATFLLKERNLEKLYMFSKTNVIPTVRVAPVDLDVKFLTLKKVNKLIKENNGTINFEQFEELFNLEMKAHGLDYEKFVQDHMGGGIEGLKINIADPEPLAKVQALLPPLNLVLNKIWISLNSEDRKAFRSKYHPFMCLNRSPLPLPSAELLIEASEAGRLTILEDVFDIQPVDNGESFEIISTDSSLGVEVEKVSANCKWICNATGLDTSLSSMDRKSTLIGSMLDKRYLQVDDYGGVTVLPKDMTAVSPRFGNMPALHVHGVLVSGVQYRNNSTLIIQKTAHDLIKSLYSNKLS